MEASRGRLLSTPVQFPQLVVQITNLRSFDVFLVGFTFTQDPDESTLWHSRNTAPGGFNGFGYRSQAADNLLDAAVATVDQAKRQRFYFRLQNLLAEDVPALILFFNKSVWAFNQRVQGYDDATAWIGPYTQTQARFWMNRLWVRDGR